MLETDGTSELHNLLWFKHLKNKKLAHGRKHKELLCENNPKTSPWSVSMAMLLSPLGPAPVSLNIWSNCYSRPDIFQEFWHCEKKSWANLVLSCLKLGTLQFLAPRKTFLASQSPQRSPPMSALIRSSPQPLDFHDWSTPSSALPLSYPATYRCSLTFPTPPRWPAKEIWTGWRSHTLLWNRQSKIILPDDQLHISQVCVSDLHYPAPSRCANIGKGWTSLARLLQRSQGTFQGRE